MNEQLICIHYHRIIVSEPRTTKRQVSYEKPFNFTFFPGAMLRGADADDDEADDDGWVVYM
jgi:hypothetical protein